MLSVHSLKRILTCLLLITALMFTVIVQAVEYTGADIVQRCDHDAYAGADQRTILSIILRDASGNERKNIYRRYWKYIGGKNKIEDKMVLFTEFPPDAKGTGFMRWGYVAGSAKNADQWLYLPSLASTRRVSVRDPGDSFLGSDLTYQDVSPRLLEQDEHTLLREEKKGGVDYYVVESVPKEDKPLYGKIVAWYEKSHDWADCNKRRIEHFDGSGNLIKTQALMWQKVGGKAWLWSEVVVNNMKTGHSSVFGVTEPAINIGLEDRVFTERTLKRGIR